MSKQSIIAVKSHKSKKSSTVKARALMENRWEGTKHFQKLISAFGSQPSVAIIGLLTAVSLLLSLTYQVGYMVTIDYRLISLFSVQDAISSSIHAIPLLVSWLLGGLIVYILTTDKMDEFVYGNPRQENELDSKIVVGILLALASIAFVIMFFVAHKIFCLFFVVLFLSGALGVPFSKKGHMAEAAVVWWLICSVQLIIPVAAIGEMQALIDLDSDQKDYRITVGNKQYDVLLLKATSDVLIVRDDPRTVKVIPKRLVNEIEVMGIRATSSWLSLEPFWNLFGTNVPIETHGR